MSFFKSKKKKAQPAPEPEEEKVVLPDPEDVDVRAMGLKAEKDAAKRKGRRSTLAQMYMTGKSKTMLG